MFVDPSSDRSYTLKSEELSVMILPDEGGRIASLRSLSSGMEFLTQSRRRGQYPAAGLETPFQVGPCAGIEECLPTVAPCGAETEGGPAPDHGDFWQVPWHVRNAHDDALTIEADGFSRTLRFRKTLTVEADTLRVAYSIRNVGFAPQSFLYACHPLFAVDAGDRIVLPDEAQPLRLDYSRHDRLGKRGDLVHWPVTATRDALDVARAADAGTAEMLYTARLRRGVCGIERVSIGQMLEVQFPVDRLPYLGIWLCYGGWPDDGAEHLQYAVALEPTTAPWNTLTEAQAAGGAITLAADQTYEFEIAFRVAPAR